LLYVTWAYLRDVLERLPTHLNSRIDELLPHRRQPAKQPRLRGCGIPRKVARLAAYAAAVTALGLSCMYSLEPTAVHLIKGLDLVAHFGIRAPAGLSRCGLTSSAPRSNRDNCLNPRVESIDTSPLIASIELVSASSIAHLQARGFDGMRRLEFANDHGGVG
jgi:hypothetical protein